MYGKWYGRTHMLGTVGINELSQQIQNRCTVRESDIFAVLSELSDAIAGYLATGYQVRIPGLGIFHVTMTTEPADTKEEFTDLEIPTPTNADRQVPRRTSADTNWQQNCYGSEVLQASGLCGVHSKE